MPLIKPTTTTTTETTATTQAATTTKAPTKTKTATATTTTTRTAWAKSVPATPVQPKPSTNFVPSSPETGDYAPPSYPNFTLDISDDNELPLDMYEDEDSSSIAMITPPPPYDTPQLQATTGAQTQPSRKFLFHNREIFSMSPATPSNSLTSAITPTKLSAAAAAMFGTPQMAAQLNRTWTNLHRKRRRRNSSSGDSKELDQLVLQSVDWDENDIY